MAEQKASVLVRVSVPERLGVVFEKVAFDVPHTPGGLRFTRWWDSATRTQRDQVLKLAFDESISLVEAREKLELE